jgi:2-polyprenyl-6-methoxyphenol hydroxylase-like FAD-dependent oxidoreductase
LPRVVIVGAGIGGLCAARAAALAGCEPVVLERSPEGTAIGAGLLLWPNAVHALDVLGLGAAVRAVAAPARRSVMRDAGGRVLSELDVGALGRRADAPMLVVERPALHEVLADRAPVRRGVAVSAADQRGVTLQDGSRVDGDIVIGADGIGSVAREHVCPGARPIDSGYTVVRGIAEHDIGSGETYETWGRGDLVGGAALPAGRSYWFYEAPAARIDERSPLTSVGPERWPEPTAAQLAATPPEAVLVNRILRLPRLPTWTRGAVALLGDAAHAMEPNLGQGAAQAIEDAEALLVALRARDEPAAALAAYAASRRRRAHMLQRESSRFARLALSTHTAPRNLLMRVAPDAARRRTLDRLMSRHALRRAAPRETHADSAGISALE